MKTYKKLISAIVLALGCVAGLMAQNGESSPYSMFGYGSLSDYSSSSQRSMGGVGYATNNGRQINVKNPASYAHCDSLTFLLDFGMDFTGIVTTENGVSGKSFGGGLDYVTMQFPLSKKVGGSLGLLPYSSVGYSFGGVSDDGGDARGGAGQWRSAFKRRRRWAKMSIPYLMREYTPNGTIVMTMNEVDFIKSEYGIDIMTPDHVKMIMDSDFLLSFVIIDQANEMVYVTYDGQGYNFMQYTYNMLEREASVSNREMREMYRAFANR